MSTSLDIFNQVVKESLEAYIKGTGYSSSQLEPVIGAAIEEAKGSLPSPPGITAPRILRQTIESRARVYIDAVLSQNKVWQDCRERIKAYSSIFLAGAGLSYESDMPLSNILDDLLKFCRVSTWDELRKDLTKCLEFKQQFKRICDNKQPSNSHRLVMLNFPTHIWEIICLNWDDLFEKAAILIGKTINKQNEEQPTTTERYLWKFHGDVDNIREDNILGKGGWVFPDEEGYVFDSFKEYIKRTEVNDQLFTFVIVGYNETEKVIYDEIIALLERIPPRPTYRIGLDLKSLHKENHIVGTAEFTLNKILPVTR